jgi:hypothetical protein
MTNILRRVFALCAALTTVGFAIADDPTKESSEQRRDRLQIAVQAICPVSGQSLTGHAKPIKMTDPETKEVLFVCCEDCLKSKADAKYLDKIHRNFANIQGHCLVMTDNTVSEKSKHGLVGGHFVYVCCPPCIKKMMVAPEKYLAMLDDLYEASLKK